MLPDILVLAHRSSESFPSDDAVLAGAAAAGLLLVGSRVGTVAVLAAAAMAFTRVYIGADYTHDVLAGLVGGISVSVLGFWATRPILLRVLARAEQSRLLRPLVTVADPVELASR
jgi:membrane-associated phospholipid phosphatase